MMVIVLTLLVSMAGRVFFFHQEVDQDQDDHDYRDVHTLFSFPRLLSRGGYEEAYASTPHPLLDVFPSVYRKKEKIIVNIYF